MITQLRTHAGCFALWAISAPILIPLPAYADNEGVKHMLFGLGAGIVGKALTESNDNPAGLTYTNPEPSQKIQEREAQEQTKPQKTEVKAEAKPEQTLEQTEETYLRNSYQVYLETKAFYGLNEGRLFAMLVSDAQMEDAQASMKYIESAFQKRYPDYDTDALWDEVSTEMQAPMEQFRALGSNPNFREPTGDMQFRSQIALTTLKANETYFREKLGESKPTLKKDF